MRFEVEDRGHGPYGTEDAANAAALVVFRRWAVRVKDLGGWAWKATTVVWCVSLPDEVEVSGGRPFHGAVLARH